MGILDFREIRSPNPAYESQLHSEIGVSNCPDDFELFAKEFFERVKRWKVFKHVSNGRDQGLDLGVEEVTPTGNLRWFVSCKHRAHSNTPVTDWDESRNLLALIAEWECDGFIPFYTTLPTNKVDAIINGIEKFGIRVKRYIKDDIEGELLDSHEGTQLAARYFPKSMVNHYGAIIKTVDTFSTKDVEISGEYARLNYTSEYIGGLSILEVDKAKQRLVDTANSAATYLQHRPYFYTALRQAISLAPQFFICAKPIDSIEDKKDARPTWDSFALYRHPSINFPHFIIAVWSFWSPEHANQVFGELMAFCREPNASGDLTDSEITAIKETESFKRNASSSRKRGQLTPGNLGAILSERERDILVRLIAFAN